jgi:putative flippase GtrA
MTKEKKMSDNKQYKGPVGLWMKYKEKHPETARFIVFFLLSNGITVLQMVLMPMLKGAFEMTSLVDTNFQIFQVGHNFDGSDYYVFNYAAGALSAGGGGGLAYFLAVQITLGLAQIINFFAQRKITFKSNNNIWRAAFWYVLAYIIISIGAAALQGLYKAPIYDLFMNTWGMGSIGETIADFITMIINSAISFWVFYPILKVIFKDDANK